MFILYRDEHDETCCRTYRMIESLKDFVNRTLIKVVSALHYYPSTFNRDLENFNPI